MRDSYPAIITLSKTLAHFEQLARWLETDWPRILVNNSSQVALTSAAVRRSWAVLEPGYNTSFSCGNNMAAKALAPFGHTHLLLINDDLVPHPDFLRELWRQRDTADVVGAMLLHSDGTVNSAGTSMRFDGPQGHLMTDHIGRHDSKDKYVGTCPYVPAITFAAVLIRRGLWRELDGLDERYYYGWEDTDFCMRALRAGATIRCNRDAVATHNECGTRPRASAIDQTNADIFGETWVKAIPGIVTSYALRVAPQKVEGI